MKNLRLYIVFLTLGGALLAATAQAAPSPASLLSLYENVSTALTADSLPDAQAAACALAVAAARNGRTKMEKAATAVGKAADLKTARTAFRTLSAEAIALARQQKGYFIVHCPMADADWVQSTRAVANPYLGKKMPKCGVVIEATRG